MLWAAQLAGEFPNKPVEMRIALAVKTRASPVRELTALRDSSVLTLRMVLLLELCDTGGW